MAKYKDVRREGARGSNPLAIGCWLIESVRRKNRSETSRETEKKGKCGGFQVEIIETDGPERFGGPFYGKMTTPSFIPQVVKAIAEIKGMRETDVAGQILQNFTDFFSVNLI